MTARRRKEERRRKEKLRKCTSEGHVLLIYNDANYTLLTMPTTKLIAQLGSSSLPK
jgi:hypothetical protein